MIYIQEKILEKFNEFCQSRKVGTLFYVINIETFKLVVNIGKILILLKHSYMSLSDLSKSCLGRDLAIASNSSKAISSRVSYWHRDELRPDQVMSSPLLAKNC